MEDHVKNYLFIMFAGFIFTMLMGLACEVAPDNRDFLFQPDDEFLIKTSSTTTTTTSNSTKTSSDSSKTISSTSESTTSTGTESSTTTTTTTTTSSHETTPPGEISNFNIASYENGEQLTLTWANPTDADFTGVVIRVSSVSYPSTVTDGYLLVDIRKTAIENDQYVHRFLNNNQVYYYTVFTYDTYRNYSSGVSKLGIPIDTKPPQNVNQYNLRTNQSVSGRIYFEWDPFTGDDADWEWIKIEATPYYTDPAPSCWGYGAPEEPDCDSPQNWSYIINNNTNEHTWEWNIGHASWNWGNDPGYEVMFSFFVKDDDGNEGIPLIGEKICLGLDNPTNIAVAPGLESAYFRFNTTESNVDTGVRIVYNVGSPPEIDKYTGAIITGTHGVDVVDRANDDSIQTMYTQVTGLTGGVDYYFLLYSYRDDGSGIMSWSSGITVQATPTDTLLYDESEDFESIAVDGCPGVCSDLNTVDYGSDYWGVEADASYCHGGTKCLFANGVNDNGWSPSGPNYYADCYSYSQFQWKPGAADPDLTGLKYAVLTFWAKNAAEYSSWDMRVHLGVNNYPDGNYALYFYDDGNHYHDNWQFFWVDLTNLAGDSGRAVKFLYRSWNSCPRTAGAIDDIRLIGW